jgi:hypothetical protein
LRALHYVAGVIQEDGLPLLGEIELPAGTDCSRLARADLAGSPQTPERFDEPQMARASNA